MARSIPQFPAGVTLTSTPIVARANKLKARWTVEPAAQLKSVYGIGDLKDLETWEETLRRIFSHYDLDNPQTDKDRRRFKKKYGKGKIQRRCHPAGREITEALAQQIRKGIDDQIIKDLWAAAAMKLSDETLEGIDIIARAIDEEKSRRGIDKSL